MLRKVMSSSMRCLSGEICLVIGVLPLKRSANPAPMTVTARLPRRRDGDGQSNVAKVILCDVSRMALLSHSPLEALDAPKNCGTIVIRRLASESAAPGSVRCSILAASMTKSRSQELSEKAATRTAALPGLASFIHAKQPAEDVHKTRAA